ncbi:methylamine utilization protein [Aestuariibacter sp. GS-14]|uniref:methylamine utilization protein n=1 Tax=Aestuariibacter sp. GS-14 TaxID=2590670 RepID=UPI00112C4678|nr:methylamine utilization protein [Aestuariibacter sp. GS-14]TPV56915.1 methylamine utilization protein [Aestuariibacter sp. GS-14]
MVVMPKRIRQLKLLVLCALTAGLSGLIAFSGRAATITIVDQQGIPYVDAVISLLQPQKDNEKSVAPETLAIMDQVDKQFLPKILVIQQGQRVVFPNSDNIRHHVYSFSEPHPFEIKLYSGNNAAPVKFDKPGIVVLGCNIHDSMVGFIYIRDNSPVWTTNQQGMADLTSSSPTVTIWHPDFSVNHQKRLEFSVNPNAPSVLTVERFTVLDSGEKTFGNSKFKRQ